MVEDGKAEKETPGQQGFGWAGVGFAATEMGRRVACMDQLGQGDIAQVRRREEGGGEKFKGGGFIVSLYVGGRGKGQEENQRNRLSKQGNMDVGDGK